MNYGSIKEQDGVTGTMPDGERVWFPSESNYDDAYFDQLYSDNNEFEYDYDYEEDFA